MVRQHACPLKRPALGLDRITSTPKHDNVEFDYTMDRCKFPRAQFKHDSETLIRVVLFCPNAKAAAGFMGAVRTMAARHRASATRRIRVFGVVGSKNHTERLGRVFWLAAGRRWRVFAALRILASNN